MHEEHAASAKWQVNFDKYIKSRITLPHAEENGLASVGARRSLPRREWCIVCNLLASLYFVTFILLNSVTH